MIFVLSGANFVMRTCSSAGDDAADDDDDDSDDGDDDSDDDDDDDSDSGARSDTPQPAKASQLMTARGSHPRRWMRR